MPLVTPQKCAPPRQRGWVAMGLALASCTFPSYELGPRALGADGGDGGASSSSVAGVGGAMAPSVGVGGGVASVSGSNGNGGSSNEAGTAGVSEAGETTGGMGQAGTNQGPPGTGLEFDGSQLLAFPAPPVDDLTIEMWIRTTMIGPTGIWYEGAALFAADAAGEKNDFGASLIGDNFAFGTGNPDVTALSVTAVNTGAWTHVAASRQRGSSIVQIIVNGQTESSIVTGNREALVEGQLPTLGGHIVGGFYNGFVGTVDEIRLWNVARTRQQIADHLHTRLNGDEAGLVGYWRLDEGQGLIAVDSSPRHQDATLGGGDPARVPAWMTYEAPALP